MTEKTLFVSFSTNFRIKSNTHNPLARSIFVLFLIRKQNRNPYIIYRVMRSLLQFLYRSFLIMSLLNCLHIVPSIVSVSKLRQNIKVSSFVSRDFYSWNRKQLGMYIKTFFKKFTIQYLNNTKLVIIENLFDVFFSLRKLF